MDTIEPGRVPVVPIGFARARRWCSDLWESTASTTMVFILLSVLLSYYLGTADHSDGSQAVELSTQDDADDGRAFGIEYRDELRSRLAISQRNIELLRSRREKTQAN